MPLVIERASGGIAIMRLIGDADAATCIARWKDANPGEYVTHAQIAEAALPTDRSTRATWSLVDGAVVIDQSLTPVPQVVTRRQARSALLLAGKLNLVQPAIDAIPDPVQRGLMQIEFDDSQTFERQRPSLIALASALGLTSDQVDQLFITAASL